MSYKDSLLKRLGVSIKELQCISSEQVKVSNDNPTVQLLGHILDRAFLDGLKSPGKGYWNLVVAISHKDVVKEIKAFNHICTDHGRARAWLFRALSESLMESYVNTVISDTTLMSKYYKPDAILSDYNRANLFLSLITGLEFTDLSCVTWQITYLDVGCTDPLIRKATTETDSVMSSSSAGSLGSLDRLNGDATTHQDDSSQSESNQEDVANDFNDITINGGDDEDILVTRKRIPTSVSAIKLDENIPEEQEPTSEAPVPSVSKPIISASTQYYHLASPVDTPDDLFDYTNADTNQVTEPEQTDSARLEQSQAPLGCDYTLTRVVDHLSDTLFIPTSSRNQSEDEVFKPQSLAGELEVAYLMKPSQPFASRMDSNQACDDYLENFESDQSAFALSNSRDQLYKDAETLTPEPDEEVEENRNTVERTQFNPFEAVVLSTEYSLPVRPLQTCVTDETVICGFKVLLWTAESSLWNAGYVVLSRHHIHLLTANLIRLRSLPLRNVDHVCISEHSHLIFISGSTRQDRFYVGCVDESIGNSLALQFRKVGTHFPIYCSSPCQKIGINKWLGTLDKHLFPPVLYYSFVTYELIVQGQLYIKLETSFEVSQKSAFKVWSKRTLRLYEGWLYIIDGPSWSLLGCRGCQLKDYCSGDIPVTSVIEITLAREEKLFLATELPLVWQQAICSLAKGISASRLQTLVVTEVGMAVGSERPGEWSIEHCDMSLLKTITAVSHDPTYPTYITIDVGNNKTWLICCGSTEERNKLGRLLLQLIPNLFINSLNSTDSNQFRSNARALTVLCEQTV